MRIGIITLPLHTNYGGILQAYALQTVLERMGHDARLIEERRKPLRLPLWKMPLAYGKRIAKNMLGHPCPVLFEQKCNRELPVVRQHTDAFINKYIRRMEVDGFADIRESEFNAFVVGSDQVWRPKYFGDIARAYLDFAEGWSVRRVAYAASFGTDEWEYTPLQTDRCGALLRRFDAVSVREASAVGLCRSHFGVDAVHVLDPTMLLSASDYAKLFEAADTPASPGSLLCYILDDSSEKAALISRIAEERHLVPFRVNPREGNIMSPLSERIQPPVEQWLRGFHDAEFVVTDSFHACVFSILFRKPFVAVGNVERGLSRFTSLLCTFGLQTRLLADASARLTLGDIDWQAVEAALAARREEAMAFLQGLA